jgi:hypothetical protein
MSICRKCEDSLGDHNQYPSFKKANNCLCISCSKAYSAADYIINKDRIKHTKAAWAAANPEIVKDNRLRQRLHALSKLDRKIVYDMSMAHYRASLVYLSLADDSAEQRNLIAVAVAAELLKLALGNP